MKNGPISRKRQLGIIGVGDYTPIRIGKGINMLFGISRNKIFALLSCSLLIFGWEICLHPELIANRFAMLPQTNITDFKLASMTVTVSLGLVFLCLIPLILARWCYFDNINQPVYQLILGLTVACSYLAMQKPLFNWIIDDAAITFAYVQNFVNGYGLVLFPGHVPEEGYSDTSWLLLLSAMNYFGADIPYSAKMLSIVLGVAALGLAWIVVIYHTQKISVYLLALLLVLGLQAPFLIWSASGLEHGMQAFLFVCIVRAAQLNSWRWMTFCLSILILTRPETPLIVIGCALAFASGETFRYSTFIINCLKIGLLPFMVLIVLLVFRFSYFGELFTNPYYVKAVDASFLKILNPFGSGWGYVFDWLSSTALYLVLPLLPLVNLRNPAIRIAASIVVSQLIFVIYAGGDWMGQYRFLAPLLPVLMILVADAVPRFCHAFGQKANLTLLLITVLMFVDETKALVNFSALPTTPMSVVATIGQEFANVAKRLSIAHPTLAHHDAGGAAYNATIDLIDLGGLGSKAIAKHMSDREFMTKLLFVDIKPTFIFGSQQAFAAGLSKFYQDPRFAEQYIPLTFSNKTYMQADLSHIRKDILPKIAPPGIDYERNADKIIAVRVEESYFAKHIDMQY
ncbi:hypothetical protein [Methylomonas sp. AM2-LC]|uniref:hypothetical protein n=1 Tax=Methylomonas sp. AM2-LC TaxID=3153301 RepID=UPI003263D24E